MWTYRPPSRHDPRTPRPHVHLRTRALDGVDVEADDGDALRFVPEAPPSRAMLYVLAERVALRVMTWLRKRGYAKDDDHASNDTPNRTFAEMLAQVAAQRGESTTGGPNKRRLGSITKQGNRMARVMLVQAAWTILRSRDRDDPLKRWAEHLANTRGKRIAVVALARKLAGVPWAMWRDGTVYDRVEHAGA